jgi:hypothetical protein
MTDSKQHPSNGDVHASHPDTIQKDEAGQSSTSGYTVMQGQFGQFKYNERHNGNNGMSNVEQILEEPPANDPPLDANEPTGSPTQEFPSQLIQQSGPQAYPKSDNNVTITGQSFIVPMDVAPVNAVDLNALRTPTNRTPTGSTITEPDSVYDPLGDMTFHGYREGKYFLPNDGVRVYMRR